MNALLIFKLGIIAGNDDLEIKNNNTETQRYV